MPHSVNRNRPAEPVQSVTAQPVVNNQEKSGVERITFIAFRIFAVLAAVASMSLPFVAVWLHIPALLGASIVAGIFALWALSSTRQPAPPQTINFYAAKA
jgi:hypothetical protein